LGTNVPFFIAKRYLFSWKKRNAINLITAISIVGIAVTTAALVILISAFNGIEQMIDRMYSEFDTDLSIQAADTKTFNASQIDLKKIKTATGVKSLSRTIDELVIIKNGERWVNARLIGVDSTFLEMAKINKHLLNKEQIKDYSDFVIPGAGLQEKLQIGIDMENNYEPIVIYAPKRKISIKPGQNPFYLENTNVSAILNYNREVNSEIVLSSFDFASQLLQYENEYSSIWIDLNESADLEQTKKSIQELVGSSFKVKTRIEKNELIYKTSQSEKIIVICILIFIFILSAFNLIASLTMLFVEKKKHIASLLSMGLTKKNIFSIFFIEGILISSIGLFVGLALGYLICFSQLYGNFIVLPGTTESFPINPTIMDGIMILFLVVFLTILFSYSTVHFLVRNNFSSQFLTIRKE
jgi:lipoprotein-releasing system permease protein